MKKVKLRMKEQKAYQTIKYVIEKKGSKERAALKLGCTIRHINRLILIYKEKGKQGFVHGNRSRQPISAKDASFSTKIIQLYQSKYQGCTFAHYVYLLAKYEDISVSYSYVYTKLMKAGITSPKIHRKTKRRLAKEKVRKRIAVISENELDLIVSHEIALEDSHPRRERSKYFGELLQMDASVHLWFGKEKAFLHLAIDDATGYLCGGWFAKQETLAGYYHVFKQILENIGIPYGFLTDNRTIFNFESSKDRSPEKDVLTQFGYACKNLGVQLDTTSVCQKKGRIERAFGTLQSRLIQEFRINNIDTLEQANRYLIDIFIPDFNNCFAFPLDNYTSVFEASPTAEVINYTLAVLSIRKIDNGNSIRFKNIYYQPYQDNKLVCFKPHTVCLVISAFNQDLMVSIGDIIYELKELTLNQTFSIDFDISTSASEKISYKYIPPMSHPWKEESFRRYLNSRKNTAPL